MMYTAGNETLLKPAKKNHPWERLLEFPEVPKTDNQSAEEIVFRHSSSSFPRIWGGVFDTELSNTYEQGFFQNDAFATQLTKEALETRLIYSINGPRQILLVLRDWPVDSTISSDIAESPEEEFRQLTIAAKEEAFEHGMDSEFSLSLENFIELYQGLAIRIISDSLASGNLDKVVAMETLRQMGLSEHEQTHEARLKLLVQYLSSDIVMTRYGAMYGLTSMDEPRIIPDVERAFANETDPYLQKYMSAALAQLRETRAGA